MEPSESAGASSATVRDPVPEVERVDPVPEVDGFVRRHGPIVMSAGRHGSWSTCECGWVGSTWTNRAGASMEWAEHIRDAEMEEERADG